MEGVVNAHLEAIITVSLLGPAGQTKEVNAVVDTGFNLSDPAADAGSRHGPACSW